MTTTERSIEAELRQAEHELRQAELEETVANAREYLGALEPLPTAADLVAPIIEALLPLHDLRERVEEHAAILERYEFIDVTDDEWRAAAELLALQHEIADLLALELSGWTTMGGHRRRLGTAMRAVLYEAMNTEELVYGCRHRQLDEIR